MAEKELVVRLGSIGPDGRRPIIALATGRSVGRVSLDSGPALVGRLSVAELRELLGPMDWFRDPADPSLPYRCPRGHRYDDAACPWC
jgi:hypothetical protein